MSIYTPKEQGIYKHSRRHTSKMAQRSAIARAKQIAAKLGGRVIVSSELSIHIIPGEKNITVTRDIVSAKLKEAGALVQGLDVIAIEPVSDEELERTGDLRPGAPSSEALVRQDRG